MPRYDVSALAGAGWVRRTIPILDYHAPFARAACGVCPAHRCSTAKALVHCQGGSGRTGTMGAAYWIAKGLAAEEAIRRVRRERPGAVETNEQKMVLHRFAARISS
jgi:protein-tyrosine phosphatase